MSETSSTALCLIQHLHLNQLGLFVLGNDHLCNALAIVDDERLVGEVDQDDTHFTAIICIDGARRVEHGDTLLDSQA